MNNEGGNMGDLDFSYEKYHLRRIREALKRRNLFMNPNNGWGIHGPHEGMNYQVYVGFAYTKLEDIDNTSKGFEVAIRPNAVYQVESSWHYCNPQDRIPVGWRLPEYHD